MGQKVHPYGFRLGITKGWLSRWFVPKKLKEYIFQDEQVRKYIKERFRNAMVSNVVIERAGNNVIVWIHTARPGMIIGRRGTYIASLEEELKRLIAPKSDKDKKNITIKAEIKEINEPNLDAQLVAENLARQIERRVFYRRAMKRAVSDVMKAGALGVKICCKGRLRGAEIARKEWYMEGRIALQTLRTNIDYAYVPAITRSGVIGVKVWINKGESEIGGYVKADKGEIV